MVRARRPGAKERLAAAETENARLRALLANPEAIVHEMMDKAPGGIHIVGSETPNITGGLTRRQNEERCFGKRMWVRITELGMPAGNQDVQQTASYCRNGEYVRTFRAGEDVLLPTSEIEKIENYSLVLDRQPANIGPDGMDVQGAKRYMSGMSLVKDTAGQYWHERRTPRFIVQRLRPEQESLTIS